MIIKRNHFLIASAIVAISVQACGKKKSDDDAQISENVSNPVNALSLVGVSLQSAAAGIGTNAALALDAPFADSDCDEHAEPKARSGESADGSGRLQQSHPRFALQHMYCMMQTDTGAPDSFIGSLGQSKFLACIMGGNLVFDGAEHSITIAKSVVAACATKHLPASQQEQVAGVFPKLV